MIFRRGPVAHSVLQLVTDLRLLFSPNSSQRLQERATNTMKDFLAVAPQLQVSHFLCLTQSDVGVNLRVIRIPQGPTLTFRVTSYSLMRDVAKAQKRPHSAGKEFEHPPLVVLNNFSSAAAAAAGDVPRPTSDVSLHLPLLSTVLQHCFPPLHLPTLVLAHCRRVVLFHFDPHTQLIDMRHFLITASPTGVSRVVRRLLKGKAADMSAFEDVADYVRHVEEGGGGVTSDSEGEVGEESKVELGDRFVGRGNAKGVRSGVRLKEVGPRLTLSLLKAEDDFCGGRVLYHHYLSKSPEEVADLQRRKEERRRQREQRRREQQRNLQRKRPHDSDGADGDEDPAEFRDPHDAADDDVEDAAWYEREVGEKPSKELFDRGERLHPSSAHDDDDGDDEQKEVKVGRFKKRRIEAREEKERERAAQDGDGKDGASGGSKKKRTGGRRVGAGPRQPWIRGRGGNLADGAGQRGGRGGDRGRGSSRGASRGRGGAAGDRRGGRGAHGRGGRGRGRGRS